MAVLTAVRVSVTDNIAFIMIDGEMAIIDPPMLLIFSSTSNWISPRLHSDTAVSQFH